MKDPRGYLHPHLALAKGLDSFLIELGVGRCSYPDADLFTHSGIRDTANVGFFNLHRVVDIGLIISIIIHHYHQSPPSS